MMYKYSKNTIPSRNAIFAKGSKKKIVKKKRYDKCSELRRWKCWKLRKMGVSITLTSIALNT